MGKKQADKRKFKLKKEKNLPQFDKHLYYEKSVQNPSNEVEFITENFKMIRNRPAHSLREDFCGTAAISCAWAAADEKNESWGIDLDPDPIAYGKKTHMAKLTEDAKKRMHYIEGNVLNSPSPQVDVCFAFNFSYFIFHKRQQLKEYFQAVYNGLKDDGVFFLDIFGGPESQTVMTDIIEHDHFKYYWECQMFNPLNNRCRFAIHFKRKGEKKRENVFVYDWRMWGYQEIRDLLEEVGFKKTLGYWEGEDEDGDGNGEFYLSEEEENCDAWVTYIAALK
jgi:SAM-dependent methyltransferase